MSICIACGLDSDKIDGKSAHRLFVYDSDGQPHWANCKAHARHVIANPELYEVN